MKNRSRIFALVSIIVLSVIAQFVQFDSSVQTAQAAVNYDRFAAFQWAVNNVWWSGTGNGDQCANFVAGALIHGGIELRSSDPLRLSIAHFFGNHLVLSALADLNLLNTGKIELILARPSELANVLLPGDVIFLNIVRMNDMGQIVTGQEALNLVRDRLQRASFHPYWDVGAGHSVVVIDHGKYAQWNVEHVGLLAALDGAYANSAVGVRIKANANRTNPYAVVHAEDYTVQQGLLPVINSGTISMGYSQENGDHLQFHSLSFAQGASQVRIRYASDMPDPWIRFRLHGLDGPVVASTSLPRTNSWYTYWEQTINVANMAQGHLFIEFRNIDLDWFMFTPGNSTITPTPTPPANLLQNGTFDTTAHPWSVILNQNQCGWTRYGVGRNGTSELSVHRPAADRCLSFWQDVPFTLNVGQTVTATIWGQRAWDGELRRGRLAIWGLGTDAAAADKHFWLGSDWQCVTVSYTETRRTRTTLRFEIYIDSVGHPDYRFDDAVLVVGNNTPCDTTPPNASITSPAEGAFINSNSLTVTASATDSLEGVAEVAFYRLNGSNWDYLGSDTTAPYELTIGVSSLNDGTHTFGIRARDRSGNWTNYISRAIGIDRTPPTGVMVAPVAGSQTSAKLITVRANPADATSGVQRVEYRAWSPEPWSNQQWIHIGTVHSAPYELVWSIPHVNSYALILARIVDRAGNAYETSWTSFSVDLRPDTIGIFRPSQAAFYLRNQNTTGVADIAAALGISTDIPVVGDWDGDGIDSIGVYRQSTGQFFLKNANSTGAPIVYQLTLGIPGDVPISGDWDGDGRDGVGVFRPSNGLIYLRNALTTGFADFTMVFGIPNDRPVAGDWNGNGKDTIGVYRNGVFYLTNTTCNCAPTAHYQFGLGIPGDVPFAGDWNEDGFDGVGVFRPTNGITYFKNALTTGYADIAMVYGIAGDFPVAGVWTHTAGDQLPPQIEITPADTEQPEAAPTFVPRQ